MRANMNNIGDAENNKDDDADDDVKVMSWNSDRQRLSDIPNISCSQDQRGVKMAHNSGLNLEVNGGLPVVHDFDLNVPPHEEEVNIPSPRNLVEPRENAARNQGVIVHEGLVVQQGPLDDRRVVQVAHTFDPNEHADDEVIVVSSRESSAEPNIIPPEQPQLICPICEGPLTQETMIMCGHIFCKECITQKIAVEKKCPTCGRRLRRNSIFRIYLPAFE